jgi:hypothetical protein
MTKPIPEVKDGSDVHKGSEETDGADNDIDHYPSRSSGSAPLSAFQWLISHLVNQLPY